MTDSTALVELEKRLAEAKGPDRDLIRIRAMLANAAVTPSGCIEWPIPNGDRGRGYVTFYGRSRLAHRVIWTLVNGEIPASKLLCHTCDNAKCVNPKHLYIGTHADNMRDMTERGRYFAARQPERVREIARALGQSNTWTKGADNPRAILSETQVAEISASNARTTALAAQYGVHRDTIWRIRAGRSWRGA